MSRAVRESVVSALAPLAVLAVVVSGVSAVVSYAGDPASEPGSPRAPGEASTRSGAPTGAPEPSEPSEAPDGAVRIVGDDQSASFLVPETSEWVAEEDGYFLGFQTEERTLDDTVTVGVDGPGVYRQGWCDADSLSSRGFVGFALSTPAEGSTVQRSAEDTLAQWSDVVADGAPASSTTSDPTTTPVRLDDGSAAWSSVSVITDVPAAPGCAAPALELRVVAATSGALVVNLILVRDVAADGGDLDGGLPVDEVQDVMRSLAPS